MRKQCTRLINKTLYTLGLFLGFSSFAAAQYGAPVSIFKINGNILSKECNEPIKSIKVSVIDKNQKIISSHFSDSIGNFSFLLNEYDFRHSIKLKIDDIDGDENYSFKSTILSIEKTDIENSKNKNWQKLYELKPYLIELPFNGKIPCTNEQNTPIICEKSKPKTKIDVSESENKKAVKSTIEKSNNNYSFNFYPNPNNGQFTVEFSAIEQQDIYIQLYDNAGKFVKEEIISNCTGSISHTINTNNLATGIYNLHLIFDDKVYSKKLIIKR